MRRLHVLFIHREAHPEAGELRPLGDERPPERADCRAGRQRLGARRAELLAHSLSTVCFRWQDGSPPDGLDRLNAALLRSVNGRGRVAISNATVRGVFALRACFVNHLTTDDDVVAIVEEVAAAAAP